MLAALLFLIWQIAILLAAARIALAAGRGGKWSAEEFLAIVLSAGMVLESGAGTLLSFAHANSGIAYGIVAGIGLLFGARRPVVRTLWSNVQGLTIWRFRLTAAVLLAAAIPLFFLSLTPIEEPDSVNYLHYLLEWRSGRLTPYAFSTNYVAFGPSRFMPALVLTRSDWFFGFIALEPLLLMALALYLIGEELEVPPRLRIWTVAAACALQHFWGCHSGVGTLKSDPLHAAGVVLLGLVLVRAARGRDAFSPVLFAFAVTFATEKYTGVFLSIAAIAVLLLLRIPIARLLPAALLFLATTGHYYLRSLLRSGNPFYPFTVRLGPIELPGTGELSATSIASNWHNPRLWRLFFLPAHGISPAGALFPPLLALMLIAAVWIIVTGLRRRPPAFWLAGLLLIGGGLFTRTFWGAGPQPNNLDFLETDLSTLRYVQGFLAMGELFVIWFLWKRGVPHAILMVLVALHGVCRLWLLYTQPHLHLFPLALWIGAAALAGVMCLARPAPAAVAIAAGLVIAAPAITERNRNLWFPQWKPIWQAIRELPPTTVFLIDDPASGFSALHFALCGPNLKHDVRTGPNARDAGQSRYVVRLLGADGLSSAAAFSPPPDYFPVLSARYGTVFEHVSPAPWNANDREAWYVSDGEMAAAGLSVDAGTVSQTTHRLRTGELAFLLPGRILRFADGDTETPAPPEGAAINLRNCGPIPNGSPQGLTYRFQDHRWQADRPKLPLPTSPVVSIEHGKFEIERLRDDRGAYLRIHALNDAAWLVMVVELPHLAEHAPFMSMVTARSPSASATFWLWTRSEVSDYTGPFTGDWHTLTLMRRAKSPAAGDHLAIGLKNARTGDYFDVREIGAIEGVFP